MGLRGTKFAAVAVLLTGLFPAALPAGPFAAPVIIGDSWSDTEQDWPGYSTQLEYGQIHNHAIGGEWLSARDVEQSWGMVLNAADYLDQHPDADSLIIEGGLNDITRGVDAATLMAAMHSIVAEAKSRSNILDILVVSPGPFGGSWHYTAEKQAELEAFLAWLPGFTQTEQIDLYMLYDDIKHTSYPWLISDGTQGTPDYVGDDGMHLNALGSARMAAGIDQKIWEIRGQSGPAPVGLVDIDADAWNDPNEINPNDDYLITVGIYSTNSVMGGTASFDASQTDIATLRFGNDGAITTDSVPFVVDINNDSLNDIMVRFQMPETGTLCGDTSINISGSTYAGAELIGVDFITTIDCEGNSCH